MLQIKITLGRGPWPLRDHHTAFIYCFIPIHIWLFVMFVSWCFEPIDMWWWLIPRIQGLLGSLMVNSCMLVGGCRDKFFMHTPYRTLDRWGYGMRMVGMLHALSASCVFPLRLYASGLKLKTGFLADERQLSRSEASCCHDWWLILARASCLFSWSL